MEMQTQKDDETGVIPGPVSLSLWVRVSVRGVTIFKMNYKLAQQYTL